MLELPCVAPSVLSALMLRVCSAVSFGERTLGLSAPDSAVLALESALLCNICVERIVLVCASFAAGKSAIAGLGALLGECNLSSSLCLWRRAWCSCGTDFVRQNQCGSHLMTDVLRIERESRSHRNLIKLRRQKVSSKVSKAREIDQRTH